MPEPRILFVCLHGAAKSVVAATHFERLAAARGLRAHATFAGTEPDHEILPRVVQELLAEGVDVRSLRPRRVTEADVASAWRVITFGCEVTAPAAGPRVERWDDVPAVSEGYEPARAAIDAHLMRLIAELQTGP